MWIFTFKLVDLFLHTCSHHFSLLCICVKTLTQLMALKKKAAASSTLLLAVFITRLSLLSVPSLNLRLLLILTQCHYGLPPLNEPSVVGALHSMDNFLLCSICDQAHVDNIMILSKVHMFKRFLRVSQFVPQATFIKSEVPDNVSKCELVCHHPLPD